MKNRIINLGVVAEIAKALEELNEYVVFVGGAVVSVYADDEAADEIRPTLDVDLTLRLFDISPYALDNKLAEKGFHPDINSSIICRYTYNDITVDIMAANDTMRGPTNRWYAIGFESLEEISIQNISIQILSAPCYLATKFEAFNHRGQGDYRTSHDFEDIIYVIDNRTSIVEEVAVADARVKTFLTEEIQKILNSPYSEEILSAHLHPLILEERYSMLLNKITALAK